MLEGPSSIENYAHDIEKLLLKTQSKFNKFLHNEVNLLIQHIIVKYQDGQNNANNFCVFYVLSFSRKEIFVLRRN